MRKTSELYQELLASAHQKEVRLSIGDAGRLITKKGEAITFGGVAILTGASGAEGGYDESRLISVNTTNTIFPDDVPEIGGCISGEIHIEMMKPYGSIPKASRISPYVRLTDGQRHSEWLKKGVFFLDTQSEIRDGTGLRKVEIHGYDALIKAEQPYPDSSLNWPAKDVDVMQEICRTLNIHPDARTLQIMTEGYEIQYPSNYSCREVLGFLAGMYGGSFVMSDEGELLLVTISGIPAETRYLVTESGQSITFGGVRILV